MPQFYMDTNILIEAKNRYYSFDLAPSFWTWLDTEIAKGNIQTSTQVYNELSVGNDDLTSWVKARYPSPLFIPPSASAQHIFSQISTHVIANYSQAEATHFLTGADPWVIAQAKDAGYSIVTLERLVGGNSMKIKIPNIADHFQVPWCDTFTMMRALGAKL